jgi:hypothetical protein
MKMFEFFFKGARPLNAPNFPSTHIMKILIHHSKSNLIIANTAMLEDFKTSVFEIRY